MWPKLVTIKASINRQYLRVRLWEWKAGCVRQKTFWRMYLFLTHYLHFIFVCNVKFFPWLSGRLALHWDSFQYVGMENTTCNLKLIYMYYQQVQILWWIVLQSKIKIDCNIRQFCIFLLKVIVHRLKGLCIFWNNSLANQIGI